MKLLMIDNYDSFTYNLVQYFGELGADIEVCRNDEISLADITAMAPSHLVVSPGPCSPEFRWRLLRISPVSCQFWVCV